MWHSNYLLQESKSCMTEKKTKIRSNYIRNDSVTPLGTPSEKGGFPKQKKKTWRELVDQEAKHGKRKGDYRKLKNKPGRCEFRIEIT